MLRFCRIMSVPVAIKRFIPIEPTIRWRRGAQGRKEMLVVKRVFLWCDRFFKDVMERLLPPPGRASH